MLITSINNNHIKEICKLKEKKVRDITGTFLIDGEHLVYEAIKENLVKEVILLEGEEIAFSGPITYVTDIVMKKISNLDSYPKIMAVVNKKKEEKIGEHLLILDDIQDPGNLGTMIRSAMAFNVDTIVLSPRTVDLYNSKVIRATQGMIFHTNVIVRELTEFIKELKKEDYLILGTNVNNGTDVRKITNINKFALIIGNEGNGISSDILSLCDKNIYIKMNERVESLNAAVAASILLYELNNGIN